jgi:hypothetical protein
VCQATELHRRQALTHQRCGKAGGRAAGGDGAGGWGAPACRALSVLQSSCACGGGGSAAKVASNLVWCSRGRRVESRGCPQAHARRFRGSSMQWWCRMGLLKVRAAADIRSTFFLVRSPEVLSAASIALDWSGRLTVIPFRVEHEPCRRRAAEERFGACRSPESLSDSVHTSFALPGNRRVLGRAS